MKNKNKKLLLALGTLTTVAAPVAAVVSCGSGDDQKVRHFGLLPTYTGQADQLIALGIHADYYPEQLNVQKPYDYLTNPGQYMTQQDDAFKAKFSKAVNGLLPKTQGVSWWNQDAKNSDDDRISNTYWQKQEGSVLLYEHYLLDDGQKVVESAWAPKHQPQTAIQTNFRASRDPYTRIPKGVFFGWDLSDYTLGLIANAKTIETGDIKVLDEQGKPGSEVAPKSGSTEFTIKGATINVKLANLHSGADKSTGVVVDADSAKIILAMRAKRAQMLDSRTGASDWFYNDWFFVDSFHRTYLDNKQFQESSFLDWMLDSTTENEFAQVETQAPTGNVAADGGLKQQQDDIKALFDASTFQGDEVKAGLAPTSRAGKPATSSHHPIYEQQEGEVGAAPMFEGAMRDNQLYLFNVAWQVSNLAKTGTPYGEDFVNSLPDETPEGSPADFSVARSKAEAKTIKDYVASQVTPTQLKEMEGALDNANTITSQLKARMTAMNKYFQALKVNGKTFGLMTIAPGHGVSTLQTMSKYSFIYKELGFAQPIPSDLHANAEAAKKMTAAWVKADGTNPYLNDGVVDGSGPDGATVKKAIGAGSVFNMDDNGWFWTLGNSGAIDADKLSLFKGSIDLGVVASRDANYDAEVKANSGINEMIAGMFKGYKGNADLATKESTLAKATNALSENEEEIEAQQAIIEDKTTGAAALAAAKTALATAKGKTAGLTTAKTTAKAAVDAAVEASTGSTASAFVGKLREHANYDLWNEGLKTPFVMDMLLDQIMTKSEEYYLKQNGNNADSLKAIQNHADNGYAAAKSWGEYFTKTFVKDAK